MLEINADAAAHVREGDAALRLLGLNNPLRRVLALEIGVMRDSARILSVSREVVSGRVELTGHTDLDEAVHLFGYYADEITFSDEELVGLTRREAGYLFTKRDIAYLQSP